MRTCRHVPVSAEHTIRMARTVTSAYELIECEGSSRRIRTRGIGNAFDAEPHHEESACVAGRELTPPSRLLLAVWQRLPLWAVTRFTGKRRMLNGYPRGVVGVWTPPLSVPSAPAGLVSGTSAAKENRQIKTPRVRPREV